MNNMPMHFENLTDLEKERLLDEVYNLAYHYEKKYGNCSQSVLASIRDTFGIIDDSVFKASHGLAAGVGLTSQGTCGALSAGIMVVSLLEGREWTKIADGDKSYSYKLSRKLIDKFEQEYNGILCHEIQEKMMGQSYNISNRDEYKAFEKAGGHDDKCTSVVGNGAKFIAEIILDGDLKLK